MLSLIASLSFACKVIPPGRIFPRRLIGLSTSGVRLNQHIDIYSDARLDLAMLSEFLELWNDSYFILTPISFLTPHHTFTDTSFIGFGCLFHWFWMFLSRFLDLPGLAFWFSQSDSHFLPGAFRYLFRSLYVEHFHDCYVY